MKRTIMPRSSLVLFYSLHLWGRGTVSQWKEFIVLVLLGAIYEQRHTEAFRGSIYIFAHVICSLRDRDMYPPGTRYAPSVR